jgi:Flp pilus assembly protein TadB
VNQPVAALALAAAVLVAAGRPGPPRLRVLTARPGAAPTTATVRPLWVGVGGAAAGALAWVVTGAVTAAVVCAAVAVGLGAAARRTWAPPGPRADHPAALAAAWAQLAVCLEVGLPVAAAVAAAAASLDGREGEELRRVAGLLELGADPAQAWDAAQETAPLAAFARTARRSAATGAALARAARAEDARLRSGLLDAAEARAQRAAVLITAPLGLCFLPAFLVLGIVPVVVGLAADALSWW